MTLQLFFQQLINGLVLGSFFALVALGYTMVYGVIKLLNFAHGTVYMLGAFVAMFVLSVVSEKLGSGWIGISTAMLISMITMGFLGLLIDRVAYQPLFSAPRLSILISALAVAMVLRNTVLAVTQGQYMPFNVDIGFGGIHLGGIFVPNIKLILVAISAVLMIALEVFVSHTMYGKAMRAVAIDMDMCHLMGIHVNRVIGVTFFIGTALAAAAGTMAGVYYGSIWYFMGFIIGLKAFTAAVIGGIGSIPGAMLGGLILGLLDSFGTQYFGSAWENVFAFLILIIVLVFKPTGLLGKSEIERM